MALALPNLIVILAQAAANFLEGYYVGLIGLDALAGAALVFPLVMLTQTMSAGGIGGTMSAAVARAIGSGQREKAEALVLHAVVVALVLGALFSAALLLSGPALYRAMGGRGGGHGLSAAGWTVLRLLRDQLSAVFRVARGRTHGAADLLAVYLGWTFRTVLVVIVLAHIVAAGINVLN